MSISVYICRPFDPQI